MATKLLEVIRGQVAEMYGKFRPAVGLTDEEVKSIRAEREATVHDIHTGLRSLESPPAKILREFREVMREIRNEPFTNKMPTPEAVIGRTRARCVHGIQRPTCPMCERHGRKILWTDSDDHPQGLLRGQVQMPDGSWWCGGHANIYSWFSWREQYLHGGKDFPYPPPMNALPRSAWCAGRPGSFYLEYTDGAFQDPMVADIRGFAERSVGRTLATSPCP